MASVPSAELKVDPNALYREDVFTDRRIGTIRRMEPVTAEGAPDPSRATLYMGDTQILTPMGTLPLSFEIPAKTLKEAADAFPEACRQAMERTMQELQRMRREAASSIVIPQGGAGGGLPPGGLGGGGRIQIP